MNNPGARWPFPFATSDLPVGFTRAEGSRQDTQPLHHRPAGPSERGSSCRGSDRPRRESRLQPGGCQRPCWHLGDAWVSNFIPPPFCLFSAVYANTELASTYVVRGSPRSQRDMLLYAGRTAYVCWRYLAEAVRCVSAAPPSPQGDLRAGCRPSQEATC